MTMTKISSKKTCYTHGRGPLINLLQNRDSLFGPHPSREVFESCNPKISLAKKAVHGNLGREAKFGSHLRTLALKTENFSKKIGRFSKTRKWIY